jgi:hypothetical protein
MSSTVNLAKQVKVPSVSGIGPSLLYGTSLSSAERLAAVTHSQTSDSTSSPLSFLDTS